MPDNTDIVEIYYIIDPRNESVRYIGKANDAQKRFKQHLREASRRKSPLYSWLLKMRRLDIKPRVEVAIVCKRDHWAEVETSAISHGREQCWPLLNLAPGGEMPFSSNEDRAKRGHELNAMLRNNPKRARMRALKIQLANMMRKGHVKEITRVKMREAAKRHPDLLGDWANV